MEPWAPLTLAGGLGGGGSVLATAALGWGAALLWGGGGVFPTVALGGGAAHLLSAIVALGGGPSTEALCFPTDSAFFSPGFSSSLSLSDDENNDEPDENVAERSASMSSNSLSLSRIVDLICVSLAYCVLMICFFWKKRAFKTLRAKRLDDSVDDMVWEMELSVYDSANLESWKDCTRRAQLPIDSGISRHVQTNTNLTSRAGLCLSTASRTTCQ